MADRHEAVAVKAGSEVKQPVSLGSLAISMQGAPSVPRATGSVTALSPALSVTCSIADVSDTCCTPRDMTCPAPVGWTPRLAAIHHLSHSAVAPALNPRRPRMLPHPSCGALGSAS